MRRVVFIPLSFWWISWIRSNPDLGAMSFSMHQLLSYVHLVVCSSASENVNSSMVQVSLCSILRCSYLDTIPWRTATCCPLHRSRSLLSATRLCRVPPTPSSSRSTVRYTSAPPRRLLYCLASSTVWLTQSGLSRRPTWSSLSFGCRVDSWLASYQWAQPCGSFRHLSALFPGNGWWAPPERASVRMLSLLILSQRESKIHSFLEALTLVPAPKNDQENNQPLASDGVVAQTWLLHHAKQVVVTAAGHVGHTLDHRTGDHLIVRDCCRLLPIDERLAWALRLLHVTLADSAIALDVAFVSTVETFLVLDISCKHLGLHELAFTFVLDVLALHTLALHCADLHRRHTAWRCPAPPLWPWRTYLACSRAWSSVAATWRLACAALASPHFTSSWMSMPVAWVSLRHSLSNNF